VVVRCSTLEEQLGAAQMNECGGEECGWQGDGRRQMLEALAERRDRRIAIALRGRPLRAGHRLSGLRMPRRPSRLREDEFDPTLKCVLIVQTVRRGHGVDGRVADPDDFKVARHQVRDRFGVLEGCTWIPSEEHHRG